MLRFLLLAIAILSFAPSSQGTAPGTNGRIVFLRLELQDNPISGGIWVTNPDGNGTHRLTHPANGTVDGSPDWSPDATRIVFSRQPSTGAYSIWTVAASAGDLHRLSPPCPAGADIPKCPADDGTPAWSPDGKLIVFQRLSGALRPKGATLSDATAIYKDELVVTDTEGQHVRTLVWLGAWRGDPQLPAWSPDGKRVVFLGKYMTSKTNGTGCECRSLWIVNADGTGVHRILAPGLEPGDRPDWSPDGKTILFRTHPGDDPGGIGANLYTIHPDGTGLRQLTHYSGAERVEAGTYSPDGRYIVFATSHDAIGGSVPDVFVMNVDGTHVRPITRTRNFESEADWGTG